MRILVTGVTGAIGSRLAPRLLSGGHELRALTRRSDAAGLAQVPAGIELVTGDAISGIGLPEALRGVDVAYYLIHSMEPGAEEHFGVRERRAAENFAAAAIKAGVGRIVYLGGLVPQAVASDHLASRLEVERILLTAIPNSVALRSSIVIGARSRSFRFMVRLIERMPVLVIPGWRRHSTAPVDERDVLSCLTRAATSAAVAGRSLDLVGPEVVTYGELIDRIREQLLLERPTLNIPRLTLTPIASRVSAMIAGEQHALVGPLMQGLETDLLPRPELATELLGVRRHSLDAAIERALRDWEVIEPLRAR
jgi:uncharacterized protein YbjT (DUF2867 family)